MSPTRRVLIQAGGLAALGVLAGCLTSARAPQNGNGNGGDSDDGEGDGNGLPGSDDGSDGNAGGTRPAGTGGPGISLRGVDDAPDLPVRPSVEIVEDTATDDHPPGLRVTVTNESDETVRIGEGRAVVFAYVADADGHLILLPADGEYDAKPGCWRLDSPIAVTEEYRTVEIAPGESVSRRVDLYGAAGPDACLPVGEFRFESAYAVLDDEMNEKARATWGFSLALE